MYPNNFIRSILFKLVLLKYLLLLKIISISNRLIIKIRDIIIIIIIVHQYIFS